MENKDKKNIYTTINVHVPIKSHEKLMKAVTHTRPVSVKLNLTGKPEHKIFVTSGQLKKIQDAVAAGKKEMTLRFSRRQAKHNVQVEGSFRASIMAAAARFLPSIIAALASADKDSEEHAEGNGIFLGRRDHTYQMRHIGEGLVITPVEHGKTRGLYIKHKGRLYQGEGILHSIFKSIPLLNIFF